MMGISSLSQNDNSVLSALFDPESSLSSTSQVQSAEVSTSKLLAQLQQRELLALQAVNKENPSIVEIQDSMAALTDIITSDPTYASAWNNRAQARRLLLRDEEMVVCPGEVAEIFADLSHAIELATPKSPSSTVSKSDANALASAHTHRGYLLLTASKSDTSRRMLSAVPGMAKLSLEAVEEAASRELALGGRYGNATARQLAIKTNPYAKLCGSIVREALTKEIRDFYEPQMELAS
jgi:hypothetical protein